MIKILDQLLKLDYKITFKKEINNFSITLDKMYKKGTQLISETQHLPFDHLYEQKVIDCLYWMEDTISDKL
jgi:hypothetical protein